MAVGVKAMHAEARTGGQHGTLVHERHVLEIHGEGRLDELELGILSGSADDVAKGGIAYLGRAHVAGGGSGREHFLDHLGDLGLQLSGDLAEFRIQRLFHFAEEVQSKAQVFGLTGKVAGIAYEGIDALLTAHGVFEGLARTYGVQLVIGNVADIGSGEGAAEFGLLPLMVGDKIVKVADAAFVAVGHAL